MGFWSAIGGVLKAIGSVIFTPARVITWVAEKIFSLGDTPSYNSSTATVDETKKVNELLEKCIK